MKIRIALAGELPQEQEIFGKVDLLIGQISAFFCNDNASPKMQMLISPSYTGNVWMEWNKMHKFPLCTYTMRDSAAFVEESERVVRNDTSLRNILGEAICNRADAVVVVWNEDVTEMSGATWELIKLAYDRKAPCIWISTKTRQIYCLWESYYKPYTPKYLSEFCEPLPKEDMVPRMTEEKESFGLSFWVRRRDGYLKKYKADQAVHSSVEDVLLKDDFRIEAESTGDEASRQVLLSKFRQFDEAAIKNNVKFQSITYERSILPFIATIFLAVGFYVETLLGKTLSGIFPGIGSGVSVTAGLLAGVGFLIHGCLNLYVYRLSKKKEIYRWQEEYVNDRFISEILRVLLHFAPYGVDVDLHKVCGEDKKLFMHIKHLTDDEETSEQDLDTQNVRVILGHVKEMLEDQIAYHRASIGRYEKIVLSLESWWKRMSYIGFAMVIGRGALQFILALFPIEAVKGMDMNSIVRSFLNMAALLLPAWAGYFLTKSQQNNFRYNLDNHRQMLANLQMVFERVEHLLNQEKIPMEVFNIIVAELVEMMLFEDTTKWQMQYRNTIIKPL